MISVATAAPVASSTAAPATIKWTAPAPLWDVPGTAMQQPFIAEFTTDSFVQDFLAMMAGNQPVALNLPQQTVQPPPGQQLPDKVYKLFQPVHMSYYLVTASLVCRKPGIPDRTVQRKNGEKVSFVLRRAVSQAPVAGQPQQYIEMAWVDSGPNKGWQPLVDDQNNVVSVRKDEERLPLHPANYLPCAASPGGSTSSKPCDARTVYFGYIPVDKREKYLVPLQPADIQNAIASSNVDPRLDQVTAQVLGAWRALYVYTDYSNPNTYPQGIEKTVPSSPSPDGTPAAPGVAPTQAIRQQISLNVIVDLKDFLKNNLFNVYNTIVNGASFPTGYPNEQALLTELQNIALNDPVNPGMTLTDAIKKLGSSTNLASAESDPPADTYNLFGATASAGPVNSAYLAPIPPQPPYQAPANAPTSEGTLSALFRQALDEEKANNPNGWLNIPPEIASMLKNDPASGDFYWVRLVYEHAPCDPVVSNPSVLLGFAKVFDPDAPARPIRVELPSIKLKDLRKYKRGVGLHMSPELGDVLNRVNAGMLQGGGLLNNGPSLGIALICSFSIPIITLCALIVMFIFLILLNFIFWWLPFIEICFPVPE